MKKILVSDVFRFILTNLDIKSISRLKIDSQVIKNCFNLMENINVHWKDRLNLYFDSNIQE
jgi:hypothetical protein